MAAPTFDDDLAMLTKMINDKGLGDVNALDAALALLMRHADQRCISPLLRLLDDAAPRDEAMFSIIHSAEAFDDEIYVKRMLNEIPELTSRAPKWASIVLMRVLNNESTRGVLVRELANTTAVTKQAVTWLCQKINERSVSFVEKTLPVLLAAK